MQHIPGHAEQEEILPGKNLSRTQQVCARNKAHHCQLIMWREALANASKGTSQSMWKGPRAGRAIASRHCGCREIPCPSVTAEVVPQLHGPASITVPREQALNASKGHWNPLGSRIGWSDGLGNDAVVQGSSGELWDSADRQSRQAHLLWGTSTLHIRQFWFLPWGSAHRPLQSQTKAFQLKQNPGQDRSSQVVSLHTGFILRLMASAFKARGFTFAKQSEIYIFVLPSRRQRKWVSRSQKPLQSKVSQPWLASVLYLSKVFSHQER